MSRFSIVHSDHGGISSGEYFPENLEFAVYLSDVGYTQYDMDLGHFMASRPYTEAYVTDYKLMKDTTEIQAGMHTSVQIDDKMSDVLQVAGKEWRHYLDRRLWPFDPTDPTANIYSAFERDIFDVVRDLVSGITSDVNSLPLTFADSSLMYGSVINYRIDPGDTETMLSKLNSLATDTPGFDFDVDIDKRINLYAPKKGVINNNLILEQGKNIQKLTYGERGIDGTWILGLGAGTSTRIGSAQENLTASRKYRRHDTAKDFGSLNDPVLLASLTASELARDSLPITTFSCVYIPDETIDFWTQVTVGDLIPVRGNFGYDDQIDDVYRLIGILDKPDDTGEEEITLTFDDATLSL